MKSLESEFYGYESEGTVFGSINKQNFHALPFVIPSNGVVEAFEKRLGSFDDQIKVNEFQSRTLADIRDTLLPKLLSGELSVDEAGRCVEQAV